MGGDPAGGAGTLAVAPETPEDVLGNALRMRFGTPTDCVSEQTRETLRGALDITVTVRVMPSGRVTSSSVSGRGLSAADLACMRARAEGIHLPGPVENAPRSVMATVRFEISSTPGTTQEPEPLPERQLGPGHVRAGSTLPASGTESERPRGFVPPSSTLPANAPEGAGTGTTLPAGGTETERPRGFVPPSSTLPAINE